MLARRVALAATLLTLPVAATAQTPPPMVPYSSLLGIGFFREGPEARLRDVALDVAFPPAGDFTATVRILQGDQLLHDLPTRIAGRSATMARLTFRALNKGLGPDNGPRRIEVVVNGTVAGRLDFTVTKQVSSDPFDPKTTWVVDGPWRTHAYFTYDPATTNQQRVRFIYWISTIEIGGAPKGMIDLTIKRGKAVLATSTAREVNSTEFVPKEQDLRTANGQVLLGPMLAQLSGPITVELSHAGKLIKTFSGAIKDGTFVAHPASAVPAPDPLHFLSPRVFGGSTLTPFVYFWLTN